MKDLQYHRAKYIGDTANNYDKERVETEQWKNEQKAVEAFIKKIKPKTLLDIPVGTGRFFGKHKTIGIDVSLDMIEVAEKKMGRKDKLLLGDIFNLNYTEDFDVVVCLRFLNWVSIDELKVVLENLTNASKKHLILGIHFDLGQKGGVVFHKEEEIMRLFGKNKLRVLDKTLVREDGYYIFLLEKNTEGFTFSYNIMAHPDRSEYIPELKEKLGNVKVIWDKNNDIWDTRKRCLEHHLSMGKDFSITIQDDAIVTDDFKEKAEAFINEKGEDVLYNFYMQFNKLSPEEFLDSVKKGYIVKEKLISEIAFAMPTRLIKDVIEHCDEKAREGVRVSCGTMQSYLKTIVDKVYFTMPSLVDHRQITSIYREITHGRTQEVGRYAWWFEPNKWDKYLQIPYRKYGGRFIYEIEGIKLVSKNEMDIAKLNEIIDAIKKVGFLRGDIKYQETEVSFRRY